MTQSVDQLVQERRRAQLPAAEERRRLRERANLTQADLATLIGVTREAVSRWERGTRQPRGSHLGDYAAVLRRLEDLTR